MVRCKGPNIEDEILGETKFVGKYKIPGTDGLPFEVNLRKLHIYLFLASNNQFEK